MSTSQCVRVVAMSQTFMQREHTNSVSHYNVLSTQRGPYRVQKVTKKNVFCAPKNTSIRLLETLFHLRHSSSGCSGGGDVSHWKRSLVVSGGVLSHQALKAVVLWGRGSDPLVGRGGYHVGRVVNTISQGHLFFDVGLGFPGRVAFEVAPDVDTKSNEKDHQACCSAQESNDQSVSYHVVFIYDKEIQQCERLSESKYSLKLLHCFSLF